MTDLSAHSAEKRQGYDAPLLDYIQRATVSMDWKALGTSQRAALAAAKMAGPAFLKILQALSDRPMTPDEAADATGLSLLTARPRMSDLARPRDPETGRRIAPFIVATGQERRTSSGKPASVMRLATQQEREAWQS